MSKPRRRRKRPTKHQQWKATEKHLEREVKISVARDLAAERDREAIRSEQARLKAEAMARLNRP